MAVLKRHIQEEVKAYLRIMPVVLITGARQTGKTTLVETIVRDDGFSYFTLDDELALSSARRDPSGWLASLPKPVVIDEVQRVPEIFLPIKLEVDQNRQPGQFLLTGSANPLLLPKLGDSLAGRMGVVPMLPFSQGELRHIKEQFLPRIFGETLLLEPGGPLSREALYQMLLRGGFPVVQSLPDMHDVHRWVHSYLQTMMQRDIRDISNIEGLLDFPRLFRLLATRSGALLNTSDLSRSLGMVSMTLNRYLKLLETLFFIYLLPAWYSNLGKRLVKSPKLHLCDTALLAQLLEVDKKRLQENPSLTGQFLESFVFAELLKQKSWAPFRLELYHFRDGDYEVDFVLERTDGTLVGIEIKSAQMLQEEDLRGLKHLKNLSKGKFLRGLVLHQGTQVQPLGDELWAVPLQALWS